METGTLYSNIFTIYHCFSVLQSDLQMRKRLSPLLLALSLLTSACANLDTKPENTNYARQQLESLRQTAENAYQAEDWQSAVDQYNLILDQYDSDALAWYRYGNANAELGNIDTAISALQTSIELNPENIEAWHNLGILHLRNATTTFIGMQKHAPANDPLARRGRFVVNSVGQILKQGYGITVENDAKQE